MSEKSNIQWTDSTVNFWSGCTKVSAGCANCYAETLSNRFSISPEKPGSLGLWGKGAPRQLHESAFKLAVRLNKKPWVCVACGYDQSVDPELTNGFCQQTVCDGKLHRRRIFSLSLGDWLDPEVPIEWLARMLITIAACDQCEWILCTKRPELFQQRMAEARMASWFAVPDEENWLDGWIGNWMQGMPPKHITLLASVENQAMAEKRIPQLLAIPAARRGLSLEPLLGQVDLDLNQIYCERGDVIHWLIIGGESGHNARPCNVEWIRSLVQQGKAAGVATFVKQIQVGGKLLKEYCDEWPEDLRVREWPV